MLGKSDNDTHIINNNNDHLWVSVKDQDLCYVLYYITSFTNFITRGNVYGHSMPVSALEVIGEIYGIFF